MGEEPMTHRGVRIGTSGWNYRHWQGIFYPEHLSQEEWFSYYKKHFNTVEINNTFYQLPEEQTFLSWRKQAPRGFIYAVKANRYITHMKKLKDASQTLPKFLERIRLLKENLGPVLWQLPPRWHANPERLEHFVSLLPGEMRHAFEFRDQDWFQDEVRQILERYDMIFCIHDKAGLGCPQWVTSKFVYLRFHGSTGDYGGEYGERRMRSWAQRIEAWLKEGRTVFAYFNNDAWGYAIKDAQRLEECLK
jgi:uncharacterized protein YecE (DUF72 family)